MIDGLQFMVAYFQKLCYQSLRFDNLGVKLAGVQKVIS